MGEDRQLVPEELLNCQVRKMRHQVFSVGDKFIFRDAKTTTLPWLHDTGPGE